MTSTTNRLLFEHNNLSEDLANLFDQIDEKPALREQFMQDPGRVLNDAIASIGAVETRPSAENTLLYSALKNDKLLEWARGYAKATVGKKLDRGEERRDWAKALVRYGGEYLEAGFRLSTDVIENKVAALRSESHYTTRTEKTSTERDSWAVYKVSDRRVQVRTAVNDYLNYCAPTVRAVVDAIAREIKGLRGVAGKKA